MKFVRRISKQCCHFGHHKLERAVTCTQYNVLQVLEAVIGSAFCLVAYHDRKLIGGSLAIQKEQSLAIEVQSKSCFWLVSNEIKLVLGAKEQQFVASKVPELQKARALQKMAPKICIFRTF